jgi:hypothetical protein
VLSVRVERHDRLKPAPEDLAECDPKSRSLPLVARDPNDLCPGPSSYLSGAIGRSVIDYKKIWQHIKRTPGHVGYGPLGFERRDGDGDTIRHP